VPEFGRTMSNGHKIALVLGIVAAVLSLTLAVTTVHASGQDCGTP
jgi:hypothetical protein